MKKTLSAFTLAATASLLTACGGSDTVTLAVDTTPTQNVVEIAASNPDFSTLVTAVQSAGLADTLATTQDITVFAPTNAAFDSTLGELGITAEQLLANNDLTTTVLQYHVVGQKIDAAAALQSNDVEITTLQGGKFTVKVDGSNVSLVDACNRTVKVVKTDIMATNGIIHVIDKVLLPANCPTTAQ